MSFLINRAVLTRILWLFQVCIIYPIFGVCQKCLWLRIDILNFWRFQISNLFSRSFIINCKFQKFLIGYSQRRHFQIMLVVNTFLSWCYICNVRIDILIVFIDRERLSKLYFISSKPICADNKIYSYFLHIN